MTSVVMANLWQTDDESIQKFIDRFGHIAIQIQTLNPAVALHSMLVALWPGKFANNLCKTPLSSMDELRERAKGYILMEEMSKFRNDVRQTGQKCDKKEGGSKTKSHKSDKRHNSDKRQPLPKGPKYECYTPLTTNCTIILKEVFNLVRQDQIL